MEFSCMYSRISPMPLHLWVRASRVTPMIILNIFRLHADRHTSYMKHPQRPAVGGRQTSLGLHAPCYRRQCFVRL